MSKAKDNPTPTLPLSGEGADSASLQILPNTKTSPQTPIQIKQGVSSSPCQGGGWEGVKILNEPKKTPLRRALRKNSTEPERQLWIKSDPTPTLPLSGEGADSASTKTSLEKNTFLAQTLNSFKQGISPSPCQGGGWEGVKIFNEPKKTPLRRTLRKNPTEPERLLWNRIRNRQLNIKFRRQQGIGRYIVDFYCAEYSLVIELDGNSHFTDEGIAYDQVRDEFLHTLGLIVLRFANSDVMQNIDGVLTIIIAEIKNLPQHEGSF